MGNGDRPPGDFSKNWAYTALSRAQLPTHMLVIDEPTPSQLERAETGPLETTNTDLLTRLEYRMKQRDDEDLAISQIDAAEARRIWEETLSPEAKRRVARTNRARQRQELVDGRERMHTIAAQLNDPRLPARGPGRPQPRRHSRPNRDLATTRRGRRSRRRAALLAEQLDELDRLLEPRGRPHGTAVAGEPEDILDLDLALRDELSDLTNTNVDLQQAVEPRWLVEQIGPMPNDESLRAVWVKRAEAIHEHRVQPRHVDRAGHAGGVAGGETHGDHAHLGDRVVGQHPLELVLGERERGADHGRGEAERPSAAPRTGRTGREDLQRSRAIRSGRG